MNSSPVVPGKQILVTGMHRSGTSLFASWLRECGMFMGENLIGPTPSNTRGYSEDRSFVELYELLLKLNNTNLFYSADRALVYTEAQAALLAGMAMRRGRQREQWAIKQPRAALFLPLWNQVLPDSCYIFIVRHPLAVINSLLRRESNRFLHSASEEMAVRLREAFLSDRAKFAAHYARAYSRTYDAILAFIAERKELRYAIVPFEELTALRERIFSCLTDEWGFSLRRTDISSLVDDGMLIKTTDYLVDTCDQLDHAAGRYKEMLRRRTASTALAK